MSFVAALKAEIANLEAELERSLTYIRLQEARRMLALYEKDQPAEPKRRSPQIDNLAAQLADVAKRYQNSLATIQKHQSPFQVRRGSPERAKALEAARLFLLNRVDEPTPTAAIYDHILQLGIEIGGNDPRNNLSAMLSNSPIFQSHGRAGWTLASADDNHEPDPDLMREDAIISEAEEATRQETASSEQPAPSRSILDT
ncbi:hypothetical protein ACWIEX_05950 [Bosea sp. NPDC055353]